MRKMLLWVLEVVLRRTGHYSCPEEASRPGGEMAVQIIQVQGGQEEGTKVRLQRISNSDR